MPVVFLFTLLAVFGSLVNAENPARDPAVANEQINQFEQLSSQLWDERIKSQELRLDRSAFDNVAAKAVRAALEEEADEDVVRAVLVLGTRKLGSNVKNSFLGVLRNEVVGEGGGAIFNGAKHVQQIVPLAQFERQQELKSITQFFAAQQLDVSQVLIAVFDVNIGRDGHGTFARAILPLGRYETYEYRTEYRLPERAFPTKLEGPVAISTQAQDAFYAKSIENIFGGSEVITLDAKALALPKETLASLIAYETQLLVDARRHSEVFRESVVAAERAELQAQATGIGRPQLLIADFQVAEKDPGYREKLEAWMQSLEFNGRRTRESLLNEFETNPNFFNPSKSMKEDYQRNVPHRYAHYYARSVRRAQAARMRFLLRNYSNLNREQIIKVMRSPVWTGYVMPPYVDEYPFTLDSGKMVNRALNDNDYPFVARYFEDLYDLESMKE